MVSVDCNDNATLVLHNTHVTHLPYTYYYVTKNRIFISKCNGYWHLLRLQVVGCFW